MIELGDIRVHVLSDGAYALDGGAMFGVVPRVVWEKTDPPDDRNRVTLALIPPLAVFCAMCSPTSPTVTREHVSAPGSRTHAVRV